MDWYEAQWWLDATKNGSSKWKSASGRNRTKVYIYPSYNHFDDVDSTVKSSSTTTTIQTTTANGTTTEDGTYIISPGRKRRCGIRLFCWPPFIHFSAPPPQAATYYLTNQYYDPCNTIFHLAISHANSIEL